MGRRDPARRGRVGARVPGGSWRTLSLNEDSREGQYARHLDPGMNVALQRDVAVPARVSLADLLSTTIDPTAGDAVALIVQLAQSPQTGRPIRARLDASHVWLHTDGTVTLSPGLFPPLQEVAALLGNLLGRVDTASGMPGVWCRSSRAPGAAQGRLHDPLAHRVRRCAGAVPAARIPPPPSARWWRSWTTSPSWWRARRPRSSREPAGRRGARARCPPRCRNPLPEPEPPPTPVAAPLPAPPSPAVAVTPEVRTAFVAPLDAAGDDRDCRHAGRGAARRRHRSLASRRAAVGNRTFRPRRPTRRWTRRRHRRRRCRRPNPSRKYRRRRLPPRRRHRASRRSPGRSHCGRRGWSIGCTVQADAVFSPSFAADK